MAERGKGRIVAGIAVLAVLVAVLYHYRYRIEWFYYDHFPEAVPGTWLLFALIAAVAAIAIANAFMRSWRLSTLNVLLLMTLSFALIGAFIGLVFGRFYQPDNGALWQDCMLFMMGIGFLASVGCLLFPEKDLSRIKGLVLATPQNEPGLYEMMGGLCDMAGHPRVPVYVWDIPEYNAFAFGRFQGKQGIVVFRPLMDLLDDDELEGILGHELSHILHHDRIVNSVSSACGRTLSALALVWGFLAMMAAAFLGSGVQSASKSRSKSSGAGGLFIIILFLLLIPIIIVGGVLYLSVPLAAITVAPAMSRSREFGADEGSAMLTGKPLALASALEKLSGAIYSSSTSLKPGVMTDQMICDPFLGKKRKLKERLLRTHPSDKERIARLRRLDERLNSRSDKRHGHRVQ